MIVLVARLMSSFFKTLKMSCRDRSSVVRFHEISLAFKPSGYGTLSARIVSFRMV
jgi:hypothetical protein